MHNKAPNVEFVYQNERCPELAVGRDNLVRPQPEREGSLRGMGNWGYGPVDEIDG
jgi:hypothetical protein